MDEITKQLDIIISIAGAMTDEEYVRLLGKEDFNHNFERKIK